MSEETKTQLLVDTMKLFNMMGVQQGMGVDGLLMQRIAAELDGSAVAVPRFEIPRGMCPICHARDLTMCDCDPNAQLDALRQIQVKA